MNDSVPKMKYWAEILKLDFPAVLNVVTGLLLLVQLVLRYLLLRKLPLGHLLLGTICYCVIIATIVQMLPRTPRF